MWPLLLIACGNPISNEDLLADGEFLAALPSDARLLSPSTVRLATPGDSSVSGGAAAAAADLDALTATARACTAALQAATPDERSDVLRSWDATSAAAEIDGSARLWWVKAEIIRASDQSDFEWTIDAAQSPDGDFAEVGSGRHDPAGIGDFTWDLDAMGAVASIEATEPELDASYDDHGSDDDQRSVTATVGTAAVPSRLWVLTSEFSLGWSGTFTVTDDDLSWPGNATAISEGAGGRATGQITRSTDTVTFDTCWDADGDTTWMSGAPDVGAVGAEESCVIASFSTGS